MYKYVSYVSEQTHSLSEESIQELLLHSRAKNTKHEITGLLIFFQGVFTQFLEGPEHYVEKVYRSILNDSRHTKIIELSTGYSDKRYYADWKMAYHRLSTDQFVKITGYQELDRDQFFTKPCTALHHPGIQLLESFIQGLHFA